jgi:hypothetical protein
MGRPKTGRVTSVKVANDLVSKAKMIATDRGVSLAEYCTEAMRGTVERDWSLLFKRLTSEVDHEKEHSEIQKAGVQTPKVKTGKKT